MLLFMVGKLATGKQVDSACYLSGTRKLWKWYA